MPIFILLVSASAQWTLKPGHALPGNWIAKNSQPFLPPPQTGYWTGILDPSRAALDWAGDTGVHGGIPNVTAVCAAITPSGAGPWRASTNYNVGDVIGLGAANNGVKQTVITAGTSGATPPPSWNLANDQTTQDGSVTWQTSVPPKGSDSGNIQYSIRQCAGTATTGVRVVTLAAGTYTILGGGLQFNNDLANNGFPVSYVVLRGAGADQTKLNFTAVGACSADVCIAAPGMPLSPPGFTGAGRRGGAAVWAGTSALGVYHRGDTEIILGPPQTSGTGTVPLGTGSLIYLDQRNDGVGICPAFTGVGSPTGQGNCAGVDGASQVGNTVTIHTGRPHGYSMGQCVGVAFVYLPGTSTGAGYNSAGNTSVRCGPYNWSGFFEVTAVPSPTSFQYTLPATGLQPAGGGRTGAATDGTLLTDVYGATMAQNSAPNGRQCPPVDATNAPNPSCAIDEMGMANANYYTQTEIHRLTNQITTNCPATYTCWGIDSGIEMINWRASQEPGAYWPGSVAEWDGIEDLTLNFSTDGNQTGVIGGVRFMNAWDSWIRDVRVVGPDRNGVWMWPAAHISIVDSYFAGTKGSMSQAYFMEAFTSNHNLFQNNICQHGPGCIMTGQDMGSVWAYNYAEDSGYYVTDFLMPMMTKNHDTGQLNLYESNDTPAQNADNIHGTGALQTSFRARFRGQDTPRKVTSLTPSQYQAFNRGYNWIGDVLGMPGEQTNYELMSSRLPDRTIYANLQININNLLTLDWPARRDIYRWGNYDTVTGTVRWCGGQSDPGCMGVLSATYLSGGSVGTSPPWYCAVNFNSASGTGANGLVFVTGPSTIAPNTPIITFSGFGYDPANPPTTASMVPGDPTCSGTIQVSTTVGPVSEVPTQGFGNIPGNPVPATQTLPPSFYLPQQPPFWRTPWGIPPWPAIGPDVTGGTDPTGRAYDIPAKRCFQNSPIDPAFQETHNVISAVWNGATTNGTVLTLDGIGNLAQGSTMVVSGVTPSGYNGIYQVYYGNTTANTVSYRNFPNVNPGGPGSGGTVTSPNYRLFNARTCYPDDFVATAATKK